MTIHSTCGSNNTLESLHLRCYLCIKIFRSYNVPRGIYLLHHLFNLTKPHTEVDMWYTCSYYTSRARDYNLHSVVWNHHVNPLQDLFSFLPSAILFIYTFNANGQICCHNVGPTEITLRRLSVAPLQCTAISQTLLKLTAME